MKDDVPPLPDKVPAKRRQIEAALDVHIAVWLAGELTPSERRRLEAEKARRKALVPDRPVGLLVGREGVTKVQQMMVLTAISAADPTEIHHPGVAGPLHSACKRFAPVEVHRDVRSDEDAMKEVVRSSQFVIAAPKDHTPSQDSGVWDAARYARHRRVAVQIILPNGKTIGLDGTEGPS